MAGEGLVDWLLACPSKGFFAPIPIKDSLIVASALVHDLTVATRNESDFDRPGVNVINPFA